MRPAAALAVAVALLAGCEPALPEGVYKSRDNPDEVYLWGLAAVYPRADGDIRIRPEPPKLAVRKWLYENDYEYFLFEADTTEQGRQMASIYSVEGRPEARVFWGRIVYRR